MYSMAASRLYTCSTCNILAAAGTARISQLSSSCQGRRYASAHQSKNHTAGLHFSRLAGQDTVLVRLTMAFGLRGPPTPSSAKMGRKIYLAPTICISPSFLSNGCKALSPPTRLSVAQSTHRVAIATFWHTFHPDGKISPAWWGRGVHAHPLSLYLPSRSKLCCTLQLRGQIHYPPISNLPLYVLCGPL